MVSVDMQLSLPAFPSGLLLCLSAIIPLYILLFKDILKKKFNSFRETGWDVK